MFRRGLLVLTLLVSCLAVGASPASAECGDPIHVHGNTYLRPGAPICDNVPPEADPAYDFVRAFMENPPTSVAQVKAWVNCFVDPYSC